MASMQLRRPAGTFSTKNSFKKETRQTFSKSPTRMLGQMLMVCTIKLTDKVHTFGTTMVGLLYLRIE